MLTTRHNVRWAHEIGLSDPVAAHLSTGLPCRPPGAPEGDRDPGPDPPDGQAGRSGTFPAVS